MIVVRDKLGIHTRRKRSEAHQRVSANPHLLMIQDTRYSPANIEVKKIKLAYDIEILFEHNSYTKIPVNCIIASALENPVTEYRSDLFFRRFFVNSVHASDVRQISGIYPKAKHKPGRNDHKCYLGRRIEGRDLRFKIPLHIRLHTLAPVYWNEKQQEYERCAENDN